MDIDRRQRGIAGGDWWGHHLHLEPGEDTAALLALAAGSSGQKEITGKRKNDLTMKWPAVLLCSNLPERQDKLVGK